jgi:hypothetical protein
MHPWTPAIVLVLFAHAALAAPLAVSNPGFEELYLGSNLPAEYGGDPPPGSFPVGPPPAGWTRYDEGGVPVGGASVGVLNPGTAADHAPNPAFFPAGAPEGDNVSLLYMNGDTGSNEFGISQQLTATLQARTRYTLTVEVGDIASGAGLVSPFTGFFDLRGFPGYRVQLLAGGQVLVEDDSSLTPGDGLFETTSIEVTTGDAPAQEGQPLEIRLVNRNQPDVAGVTGLEVDFDDVRLDAEPAPRPLPIGPLAGALLGLAIASSGGAWLRTRRR